MYIFYKGALQQRNFDFYALLQKILTKTLIGQIRSMQCCNSIRTGMLEAKAAKFCSKFPQHLFSVTFQLSQPCYVSPFINVYGVVAITTAIKQTKIANDCLSFSICLYYPAPPHPAPPYSLPTPTVSQVVTTPREHCSATTLLLHPIAPPPSLVSVSEQTASF